MTTKETLTWLEQERLRLGRELEKLATELLENWGEDIYSEKESNVRELKRQIGEPHKKVAIGLAFWPTETGLDLIFVNSVSGEDPDSRTCLIINRMTESVTNPDSAKEATIPELTQHLNFLQLAKDILQPQNTFDQATIY